MGGAVPGKGDGQAEVAVVDSRMGDDFAGHNAAGHVNLVGAPVAHPGDEDGVVVEVGISPAGQVEVAVVAHVAGTADADIVLKVAIGLGQLEGGATEAGRVNLAVEEVVVVAGRVDAVVEAPGNGLDLDPVRIPVGGVGLEDDGVLGGVAGDQVGAAVGDGVGTLGVGVVGGGLVEVSAELAALGLIVGPAQGGVGAVGEHGREVGNLVGEGVLHGQLVQSLHAHLAEIGDLAVGIGAGVVDDVGDQPSGIALGVQQVLHSGHIVVSGDLGDLAALGIHPRHAGAQMEGVDLAVVGDIVALGQAGLLDVLLVVDHEAVIGIGQDSGVLGLAGGQHVPVGGVGAVVAVVAVLKGVALAGEVLLDPGTEGAGAAELAPLGVDLLDLLLQDDLVPVHNQVGVHPVAVSAVGHGGDGVGGGTLHGVVTAVGGAGDDQAALQELGLGHGHHGAADIQVVSLLGSGVVLHKFAEVILIEHILIVGNGEAEAFCLAFIFTLAVFGGVAGLTGLAGGGGGLLVGRVAVATTGDEAQHHDHSQEQSNNSLHTLGPPTI